MACFLATVVGDVKARIREQTRRRETIRRGNWRM
jgi:hypothetical protein